MLYWNENIITKFKIGEGNDFSHRLLSAQLIKRGRKIKKIIKAAFVDKFKFICLLLVRIKSFSLTDFSSFFFVEDDEWWNNAERIVSYQLNVPQFLKHLSQLIQLVSAKCFAFARFILVFVLSLSTSLS